MINQNNFARLWSDFEAICDCGGRLSGTTSERNALDLLKVLGSNAMGVKPVVESVFYKGWQALVICSRALLTYCR